MTSNLTVDGTITSGKATFGLNASALIAFYGAAPAVQAAVITAVTTTAPILTGFGFSTSAQAAAIVTNLNAVLAAMKTIGLVATA